ncbi:hypothetical protein DYB38_011926 [Aphanomyces astaci]|uniref:RanBP2-type domain-containing protein n=1 Tax=Aphanomyces astaci TaxID=112090 RepID=A0A397CQF9_APHAT|nr:hypothetical protein DYB38_011926 [Aphanomyces astaci]
MNRQPRRGGNNRQLPRQHQCTSRPAGSNTRNDSIAPGLSVAVVQKHDQPTGRLTYGVVAATLTSSAVHPRGIKVRLTDGTVGRVQHIQPADASKVHTASSFACTDESDFVRPPPPTTSLLDWMHPSRRTPNAPPSQPSIPQKFHDLVTARSTPAAAIVDDEHATWNCAVCTFENSSFLVSCEMCLSSKPESS